MPVENDLLAHLLSPYAIPSVLALIIKIALVWYAHSVLRNVNFWLLALLASLITLNVSELLSFAFAEHPESGLLILKVYYLSCVFGAVSLLAMALNLNRIKGVQVDAILLLLTATGVMQVLLPDAGLAASASADYTIIRVAGPTYWLIVSVLVVSLIAATSLMVTASLKQPNVICRKKALAMLLAAAPMVIIGLVVIVRMQMGLDTNAKVTLPMAATFFITVMIYIENPQGLFNFLSHIPASQEYKYLRAMRRLWEEPVSMEDARKMFEKVSNYQATERKKALRFSH